MPKRKTSTRKTPAAKKPKQVEKPPAVRRSARNKKKGDSVEITPAKKIVVTKRETSLARKRASVADDGIINLISIEDEDTTDADKKQEADASGHHENEGHSKASPPLKWNTRMELEVKAQRMPSRKVSEEKKEAGTSEKVEDKKEDRNESAATYLPECTIKFRLPTGKFITKKFFHKLGTLQDIIEYLATEGYDSQKYHIFMHPKVNLSLLNPTDTLEECGISMREQLIVDEE